MMHLNLRLVGILFTAALIFAPLCGASVESQGQQYAPANPGAINYVEGQASIGETPIGANSVGSAVLEPGQELTTENGKVEVLLTPGVFLRAGENSAVKMVSPDLDKTQVEIDKGEVMLEVAEIHPENDIRVSEGGSVTRIQKTGLYDFDADNGQVRVFKGQAELQTNDMHVKVKGGHEVALNAPKLKAVGFKKDLYEADSLYRWSSLRSSYVAEANLDAAPQYLEGGGWYGYGWGGAGWYWDPWFDCYTFIPGDGIFYSPFRWGFYSPIWVHRAPIYFGGRYFHHFSPNIHAWGPGPHYSPGLRGGGFHDGFRPSTGFRGGFGGFRGGGFHGGGGGFHGGGGGFHGGGGGHGR